MNTCTKAALAVALTALAVISAAVIFTPDADDPCAYAASTVAVVVDENGTIREFDDFIKAFDTAAQDGQIVRLVKDASGLRMTDKTVTVDLNGHTTTYWDIKENNNITLMNGAISGSSSTSIGASSKVVAYGVTFERGIENNGELTLCENSVVKGTITNTGKVTLCDSTWKDRIYNTGGDLTLINSEISESGSMSSYIIGGKVTVYNSYIRVGNATSIFYGSESVTVYGGLCMSGYGGTFTNVKNVNIYGGAFYAVNHSLFKSADSTTLNVHGGLFYGTDSDKTRLSESVEGHEMYDDGAGVFVMYDLYGCEDCGKLDCTTGHFGNKNDLEHGDILIRFTYADSICASILAIDLHDLMPSVYAEGTYGYNLYSKYSAFDLLSKDGASCSLVDYYDGPPMSYWWTVTGHTDSPDTPGSGTGTGDDDDDAGDLPPNVGPSASNSASGSSDSWTISIIAAAVVVIAMGVGALFVFREH